MRFLILLLLISASVNAWASTPSLCEGALTMNGPTKNLASYLAALIDRQLIGDKELLQFIDGLDQENLVNPIAASDASTQSALLIHRGKLERLLSAPNLELVLLRDWAVQAVKEKNHIKKKQAEVSEETHSLAPKLPFVAVPASGDVDNKVLPFEIMSTHVTQQIWLEIMEQNPSCCTDFGTSAMVNGEKIIFLPNHPVENITFWSALVFANRLSVLSRLPTVYDLSQVRFDLPAGSDIETEAAKGRLQAIDGAYRLNARPGQTLADLPGFRLPTLREMKYLLANLNRDKVNGFFPKKDPKILAQYAWFEQIAAKVGLRHGTHAVAKRRPFTFETSNGSFEIYDLLGNVETWVVDEKAAMSNFNTTFGGSWADTAEKLFQKPGSQAASNIGGPAIGIRLVRSMPK